MLHSSSPGRNTQEATAPDDNGPALENSEPAPAKCHSDEPALEGDKAVGTQVREVTVTIDKDGNRVMTESQPAMEPVPATNPISSSTPGPVTPVAATPISSTPTPTTAAPSVPVTPVPTNGTTSMPAMQRAYPSWGDPPPAQRKPGPPEGEAAVSPAKPPNNDDKGRSQDQAGGDNGSSSTEPPPPEASTLDTIVQDLLREVKSGWDQAEQDRWIYDRFLDALAGYEGLLVCALMRYLDWMIARFEEVGYKPRIRAKYKAIWKDIAKAKAEERRQQKAAENADQQAAGRAPGRFIFRELTAPGSHAPNFTNPFTGERQPSAPPVDDFRTAGIFDTEKQDFLTNFTVHIDEELGVQDEAERRKVFKGRVVSFGRERTFSIDAADYANDAKLRALFLETAGIGAVMSGKMDMIRAAISSLNYAPGFHTPIERTVTTNFGWNQAGDTYSVPSGSITANGFVPVTDQSGCRVDLSSEERASQLDLRRHENDAELHRVKEHVIADLLKLHEPRVTYSLLGAVAAAILVRFSPTSDALVVWLLGLTGAGKSFLAKLFMNFFGTFPIASGNFVSWSATANYIQRTGYYFKDALFLVDDYKPDMVQQYQVVRVLQTYADRTGRGRLKVDATTNTTRPIRGLLLSTGEDLPEHTASAVARTIVINVPQREKDLDRGGRCEAEASNYNMVTGDFICHLLAMKRTEAFAASVKELRRFYYKDIAGQQNDSRIAGNFAVLGAAFREIAFYFSDVWPDAAKEVDQFLNHDLVAIRDQMLGIVREQQPSEVFWSILGTLLDHNAVTVHGSSKDAVVIGKPLAAPGCPDLCSVSTDLALGEVNKCLKAQGKPELRVTMAALLAQLRREGRLYTPQGQPVAPDDKGGTAQLRIGGMQRRTFITRESFLVGHPRQTGHHHDADGPAGVSQPAVAVTPV